MRPMIYMWQLLSVLFAGVLTDHQHRVIKYLRAENQILREQIGAGGFGSPTTRTGAIPAMPDSLSCCC